jgi:Domain of Unknown Function (DUF1206)
MARTARASKSNAMQALGRAGMVCYGLIHVLVAYLALRVAFGDTTQQADQRGAIAEIGSTGAGGFLLWVLAIGLFAFAGWQLLLAAKGYHWVPKEGKRTRKRIAAVGRAVIGVALGVTAARLASGSAGGGSGNQQQQTMTAKLLALPAGPSIVLVVALVIIALGIVIASKGLRKSFLRDLDVGDLPHGTVRWVRRLGVLGHIAKGLVIGIVGVLIGIAALDANPKEAGGLDAALRTLAAQPFGTVALVVVGLGLGAYGVYCLAAARAHKA